MCEDFPCCGHESGCCPDFDAGGRQLNMRCTCGARLPLSSRSSICKGCMAEMNHEENMSDCKGHETTSGPMGTTVYCDGSCRSSRFGDEDEDYDDDDGERENEVEDYEREYSPDDDGEALLGGE